MFKKLGKSSLIFALSLSLWTSGQAQAASVGNILMLLGGSYMGVKTAMKCPGAPSAYLFTAASVMTLFGEFTTNKSHEDANAANAQATLNNGEGQNGAQIELLEGSKRQLENSQKAAAKKNKNAKLSKTMFMAAQVTAVAEAIYEAIPPNVPGVLCAGGMGAASKADLIEKTKAEKSLKVVNKQLEKPNLGEKLRETLEKEKAELKGTIVKIGRKAALKEGVKATAKETGEDIQRNAKANSEVKQNPLIKATKFVTGVGKKALSIIPKNNFTKNAGSFIKKLTDVRTGIGRSVAFAPFTLKSMAVAKDAKKVEGNLTKGLATLNNNIQKMKVETGSSSRLDLKAVAIDSRSQNSVAQGIRNEQNGVLINEDKLCASGAVGEFTPDPNCTCQATNSCKKVDIPSTNFPGIAMPGVYDSALKDMNAYSTSLYNGNTSGANLAADRLTGRYAALKNLRDKMVLKLNHIRKKNGDTPYKEYSDQDSNDYIKLASLTGVMNRNLRKSPMYASLGLGSLSTKDKILAAAGEKDVSTKMSSSDAPVKLAAAAAPNTTTQKKDELFNFADDFGMDEDIDQDDNALAADARALGDYESNESDITDRPETSIFKIISSRYLRSAYPVFFKKKL